jgi:signal transduction histidine kinase
MILVNVLVHSTRGILQGCPWFAVTFSTTSILALIGYLSWPWLQRRFGRFYLPIALVFTVTFSLVAQNLFLAIPLSISAGTSEESAWQIFLFLFIPLLLVSWQYGFKWVIIFCLFITLLDFALVRFTNSDYFVIQHTYHRLLFIRFLSFLLVGYIIARIMQQLRQERQRLREANSKLGNYLATLEQLTVSRERNRVARELHDTLAHTLSGLAVQLEAVDSLWDKDRQQAHNLVQHSLKATRDGLIETRNAIQSLRTASLEDMGLVRALREYIETTANRSGFHVDFNIPQDIDGLPPEIEQCFYRIGQEAIENVSRHAQAKSVKVLLTGNASELSMTIEDDGRGFCIRKIEKGVHFGIQGMYERAELIHAVLEITSHPEKGTSLSLSWKGENR